MKKMLFTLVSILTITVSANAMPYEQARREALFLTDKMAYELNLTDAQYEAAYEINLDYLMSVTSQHNVFGPYWDRRNLDLSYILYQWQWDAFRAATYFYRPLYWETGLWHFSIYVHYPHRDYFYFGRPHFYATYRGGHSWRHNGGRSWYEGRHDHFRPVASRDHHVGMRNHWDRGDYRNPRNNDRTISTTRNHGSNDRTIGTTRNHGSNDRTIGTTRNHSSNDRTIGTTRNHGSYDRTIGTTQNHGSNDRTIGRGQDRGTNNSNNGINNRTIGGTYDRSTSTRSSGTFRNNGGSRSSNSSGNWRSNNTGSRSSTRSAGNASQGSSNRSGGGRR